MPDQSLLSYIKQNLGDGFSEMEIRQALLDAGWGAVDVEEAFLGAAPVSRPQATGMDILEKELSLDTSSGLGFLHRHGRGLILVLILVIILPVLGFGGFWAYQRYVGSAPPAKEEVNSATLASAQFETETANRDRQMIEHIETLQTALSAFYHTKRLYPQTIAELVTEKLLPDLPSDPKTGEDYLYIAFGEPPLDYSLTFVLETDFGTLKKGLNEASPQNLLRAAAVKTEDQTVKGMITKTPSAELVITDLSETSFAPGDEVSLVINSATVLNETFLLVNDLQLNDEHEPFRFTFTAPREPGEYQVRVFGFAKNGSILYQTTRLVVKP